MYGPIYRHLLLPVFERLIKGRHTLSYWKEAEASQWWDREQLEVYQLGALKDLLIHAQEHCPWYTAMFQEHDFHPEQLESIERFQQLPLLTRQIILDHRQKMQTTQPIRLFSKSTGGSSGQPLHFDLDTRSNEKRVAMTHRGYNWANAAPGTKQFFIWGSHVGKVSAFKRWKAALHHRLERHKIVSCFNFTPEKMREAFDQLNQYQPDTVIAYTNPLYEFARFLDQESLIPFSPKSLVVGAEKLHQFQRELIEKVFQAPVFETYGSREFMLIGAECEEHSGLHLSMENLLVEILNDDGTPTPAGEEGNVVITDLFNYGMPFVRYVNGDRAIAGFQMCKCGRGLPLLRKVVGRQLDILSTPDGRRVPGEFFPHLLKEFSGIKRFQVVQSDPEVITLKLVTDESFTQVDHALLLTEVYKCTGTETEIVLEFVDEIPLTNAGKLRVVVKT